MPVVPVTLQNLWGSVCSRIEGGTAMVRLFRRGLLSRVGLVAGKPLWPVDVTPQRLEAEVGSLRLQTTWRRPALRT